jgi:hypothetical protein
MLNAARYRSTLTPEASSRSLEEAADISRVTSTRARFSRAIARKVLMKSHPKRKRSLHPRRRRRMSLPQARRSCQRRWPL